MRKTSLVEKKQHGEIIKILHVAFFGLFSTLLPAIDESGKKSTLKGTRKDVVDIILNSPHITIPQIAEQLGLNARGIAKHIKNLQEEGIIKRIGPDKGGHWEVIEE